MCLRHFSLERCFLCTTIWTISTSLTSIWFSVWTFSHEAALYTSHIIKNKQTVLQISGNYVLDLIGYCDFQCTFTYSVPMDLCIMLFCFSFFFRLKHEELIAHNIVCSIISIHSGCCLFWNITSSQWLISEAPKLRQTGVKMSQKWAFEDWMRNTSAVRFGSGSGPCPM